MGISKADDTKPYSVDVYNHPDVTDINNPIQHYEEYNFNVSVSISKIYDFSNKPAAASGNLGFVIMVPDEPDQTLGIIQRSNGVSWVAVKWPG